MLSVALGLHHRVHHWCLRDSQVALDYMAVWLSPSVNTGQLRLVRSIRLARALRGIRIVWLFEYVGALRTLALSIIRAPARGKSRGGAGAGGEMWFRVFQADTCLQSVLRFSFEAISSMDVANIIH